MRIAPALFWSNVELEMLNEELISCASIDRAPPDPFSFVLFVKVMLKISKEEAFKDTAPLDDPMLDCTFKSLIDSTLSPVICRAGIPAELTLDLKVELSMLKLPVPLRDKHAGRVLLVP